MFRSKIMVLTTIVLVFVMAVSACTAATPTAAPTTAPTTAPSTQAPAAPPTQAPKPITFGMILVGPYNDSGWSESTYIGGQYVESNMPGAKLLYVDNSFSQTTTPSQQAEALVSQGASVIIFNSDSFKDDSNTFAQAHPDIVTFMLSGDQEWQEGQDYKGYPNMINIMGKMILMKQVAGCAAALTTQNGKIGYLGPLINDETRRLADSIYLGAKYCWTNYLGKNASDLTVSVQWIGYWFNEPGITLDPTSVADDFFNTGYDVVASGIDTTEALVEAKKYHDAGQTVWAIPYDFYDACAGAPDICLGVPYFNWGPALLKNMQEIAAGTWTPHFEWNPPVWDEFNNPNYGGVGFTYGAGLSAANQATLEDFVSKLAGGLDLWTGPIYLQDGTEYLKDGEVGTDPQVWYMPQLLQTMLGASQ